MDTLAKVDEVALAEDVAILKHLQFYEKYSSLQQQLKATSGDAFIKLSRAKYHGTQLTSDSFPERFESYLIVKSGDTQGSSDGAEHENLATTDVLRDKDNSFEQQTTSVAQGDMSTLTKALRTVNLNDNLYEEPVINSAVNSDHATETKEHLWTRGTWSLEQTADKKRNPLKMIEILPSQPLRQTQSAFHALVQLSVELAKVRMEIQNMENVLHKSVVMSKHATKKETTTDKETAVSETETQETVANRADEKN